MDDNWLAKVAKNEKTATWAASKTLEVRKLDINIRRRTG
jgi:hypothetical protein